jgi:predicted kinase
MLRELPKDSAPIVIECRAPAAVLQQRARAREHDPGRISDAGPEVAERLRLEFEPLEDDVTPDRHFVVRTDRSDAEVLDDVVAMLDLHLSRATASP